MNSKSPIFTAQSDVALRIHVDRAVRHYFAQLQGEQPSQVYDMVLAEMEKPLLSVVLEYTRGNQTRAAETLGLNRGTIRKKLNAHGIISEYMLKCLLLPQAFFLTCRLLILFCCCRWKLCRRS